MNNVISKKTVRVGCHSGFWGDSNFNAAQLVEKGNVDYLTSDYLAETTMSLLASAMLKNPNAGYAVDFITAMAPLLGKIKQQGIKVITNAGGLNSAACRDALLKLSAEQGIDFKVALVSGDDLMPRLDEIRKLNPREMGSGESLPENMVSMNAYIGAPAIKAALDAGAEIVICGRCTDSAVVVGALMHEFMWNQEDYDHIAAAVLAGHVVECSQQATGGSFTDWEDVLGWDDMGLPIIEMEANGSFVVSKPPQTGGLVSIGTVAEQILYEMGDPQAYLLPDITCDLTDMTLTQVGKDLVQVEGVKGRAPTPTYKISGTYFDGFKSITSLMIAGRDASKKAHKQLDALIARARRLIKQQGFKDFLEVSPEVIGAEETYGANRRIQESREVIIKLGVRHEEKGALEIFAREIATSGVSMSQGTTGMFAGRPKISPVIRHYAFLLEKKHVPVYLEFEGQTREIEVLAGQPLEQWPDKVGSTPAVNLSDETIKVPLIALAWGRSGDKGDGANIGLIAREPVFATIIREQITTNVVAQFFAHYNPTRVRRWEMPGINAFNFIIDDVLGGGGAGSLRYDSQGKTYAQMFLDYPVEVPASWIQTKPRIAKFAREFL